MPFRRISVQPYRPSVALLVVGLTVAVATTACSSSPVAPTLAAGSPTPAAGSSSVADALTAPPEPSLDLGGTSSAEDPSRTVALPMKVRVANLYLAKGSSVGSPIEVWNGTPAAGGKKLQTVPYGQVSSFFAPEVPDPTGQGVTGQNVDYSLTIYTAGHVGADDELMEHSEKSAPGEKLTLVASPGDADSTGMFLEVFTDELGSAPQGSGFSTVSLPPPPAGTAVLSLNATGLEYRPGGSSPALTPSTTKGACIAYLDRETHKLHDMASDTIDMFGGTSSQSYPMQPGAPFRLNQVKDQQTVAAACADTPVAGPFDPGLTAGERAYGLVYGATLASAKLLVVPVG